MTSFLRSLLAAPPEAIKDLAMYRVRLTTALLAIGHPLFYVIWTVYYPQPFESIVWRLLATVCAATTFALSFRRDVHDRLLEIAWVVTCCFGMTTLPAWYLVANGANTVWLASYCVMSILFFTQTDWRIAILACILSIVLALWFFPLAEPALWALMEGEVFTGPVIIVVFFSLLIVGLAHLSDSNVRKTRRVSQRQALGTAAHEVRTPLAGIGLLSGALVEVTSRMAAAERPDPEDIESAKTLAAELTNSVQNTQLVISTQLANSNPDTAFSHRAPVNIKAVVLNAVHDFAIGDNSRKGSVKVSFVQAFHVSGDAIVLKQVLINLLENALTAVVVKARHPYPGCIEILTSASWNKGVISVRDHGIGLSKRELARIFKPFYTRSTTNGHGLGLAFAQSAIRAYGGRIAAESQPGAGSVFTITFDLN